VTLASLPPQDLHKLGPQRVVSCARVLFRFVHRCCRQRRRTHVTARDHDERLRNGCVMSVHKATLMRTTREQAQLRLRRGLG
jgi:hypothetical protein